MPTLWALMGRSAEGKSQTQTQKEMKAKSTFATLSGALSRVRFTTPLSDAFNDYAGSLAEAKANNVTAIKSKNCYLLRNRWFVKFYHSKKQYLWTSMPFIRFTEVFRLTDMLILRHHARRVSRRGATQVAPLTDEDFNLGLAQARKDCENEGAILSVIVQMEAELPEQTPRKERVVVNKVRTARQQFESFAFKLEDILVELKSLRSAISDLKENTAPAPVKQGETPDGLFAS